MSNVEFGMNAVFNSIPFEENDSILVFSLTYGAVKMCLQDLCSKKKLRLLELELKFPLTPESIIFQLEEFLKINKIRFALFEHISSPTAILFPIKEMIKLCHSHSTLVMIDGAHSLGQIELNLTDINADFYVTNGHKWFCNNRGCGI